MPAKSSEEVSNRSEWMLQKRQVRLLGIPMSTQWDLIEPNGSQTMSKKGSIIAHTAGHCNTKGNYRNTRFTVKNLRFCNNVDFKHV